MAENSANLKDSQKKRIWIPLKIPISSRKLTVSALDSRPETGTPKIRQTSYFCGRYYIAVQRPEFCSYYVPHATFLKRREPLG